MYPDFSFVRGICRGSLLIFSLHQNHHSRIIRAACCMRSDIPSGHHNENHRAKIIPITVFTSLAPAIIMFIAIDLIRFLANNCLLLFVSSSRVGIFRLQLFILHVALWKLSNYLTPSSFSCPKCFPDSCL